MGYSVVCMVRSGWFFPVLLLDSFFFSFLLAFGGVGELSVNKYGCVVGKRVVCYHVLKIHRMDGVVLTVLFPARYLSLLNLSTLYLFFL